MGCGIPAPSSRRKRSVAPTSGKVRTTTSEACRSYRRGCASGVFLVADQLVEPQSRYSAINGGARSASAGGALVPDGRGASPGHAGREDGSFGLPFQARCPYGAFADLCLQLCSLRTAPVGARGAGPNPKNGSGPTSVLMARERRTGRGVSCIVAQRQLMLKTTWGSGRPAELARGWCVEECRFECQFCVAQLAPWC
jgi:hypothetical protein